jgi:hypothetical protein
MKKKNLLLEYINAKKTIINSQEWGSRKTCILDGTMFLKSLAMIVQKYYFHLWIDLIQNLWLLKKIVNLYFKKPGIYKLHKIATQALLEYCK